MEYHLLQEKLVGSKIYGYILRASLAIILLGYITLLLYRYRRIPLEVHDLLWLTGITILLFAPTICLLILSISIMKKGKKEKIIGLVGLINFAMLVIIIILSLF